MPIVTEILANTATLPEKGQWVLQGEVNKEDTDRLQARLFVEFDKISSLVLAGMGPNAWTAIKLALRGKKNISCVHLSYNTIGLPLLQLYFTQYETEKNLPPYRLFSHKLWDYVYRKPSDKSKRVRYEIEPDEDTQDELTPQSLEELKQPIPPSQSHAAASSPPRLTRRQSGSQPSFEAAQPLPHDSQSQPVVAPPRLLRSNSSFSPPQSPPHQMWQYGEEPRSASPLPDPKLFPGFKVQLTSYCSIVVRKDYLELYRGKELRQMRKLRNPFNSFLCFDVRVNSIQLCGSDYEGSEKNGNTDIVDLTPWIKRC